MADSHASGGAGGGLGGKLIGIGAGIILIMVGINALGNVIERRPVLSNVLPPKAAEVEFSGLTPGVPGGGHVRGAPRNPAECIARGGRDTGRGCSGYR